MTTNVVAAAKIFNLYHTARTALAGGDASPHARMIWAAREFHNAHPDVTEARAYKELSRMRDNSAYMADFWPNR